MKVTGLMIGDWVKMKGRQGYDRVRRIGMDENKQWYVSFVCIDLFHVYEFEPIPLTQEILEKNGFKFVKNSEFQVSSEKLLSDDTYIYIRFHKVEKWSINLGRRGSMQDLELNIPISYVHQLQHALHLCGLEELAENFKV